MEENQLEMQGDLQPPGLPYVPQPHSALLDALPQTPPAQEVL